MKLEREATLALEEPHRQHEAAISPQALAREEELMVACYEIMLDIKEFKAWIGERTLKIEEVRAFVKEFMDAFGETVTKSINTSRTNVSNAMRTSFLERARKKHYMPTPEELSDVIHRKGLQDDPANKKSRDIFIWFWDDSLPKVCGKIRWGRTNRNYVTICEAHHPQNEKHKPTKPIVKETICFTVETSF